MKTRLALSRVVLGVNGDLLALPERLACIQRAATLSARKEEQ